MNAEDADQQVNILICVISENLWLTLGALGVSWRLGGIPYAACR